MTFYNNKLKREIVYESPHGWYYQIGVYQEEYPNRRSETVTGAVREMTEEEAEEYISEDQASEIPKEQVPEAVLKKLRKDLPDADAP